MNRTSSQQTNQSSFGASKKVNAKKKDRSDVKSRSSRRHSICFISFETNGLEWDNISEYNDFQRDDDDYDDDWNANFATISCNKDTIITSKDEDIFSRSMSRNCGTKYTVATTNENDPIPKSKVKSNCRFSSTTLGSFSSILHRSLCRHQLYSDRNEWGMTCDDIFDDLPIYCDEVIPDRKKLVANETYRKRNECIGQKQLSSKVRFCMGRVTKTVGSIVLPNKSLRDHLLKTQKEEYAHEILSSSTYCDDGSVGTISSDKQSMWSNGLKEICDVSSIDDLKDTQSSLEMITQFNMEYTQNEKLVTSSERMSCNKGRKINRESMDFDTSIVETLQAQRIALLQTRLDTLLEEFPEKHQESEQRNCLEKKRTHIVSKIYHETKNAYCCTRKRPHETFQTLHCSTSTPRRVACQSEFKKDLTNFHPLARRQQALSRRRTIVLSQADRVKLVSLLNEKSLHVAPRNNNTLAIATTDNVGVPPQKVSCKNDYLQLDFSKIKTYEIPIKKERTTCNKLELLKVPAIDLYNGIKVYAQVSRAA